MRRSRRTSCRRCTCWRRDDRPVGGWWRRRVVASRQTLLSTYLFYQALAFIGGDIGEVLAALERGGDGVHRHARGVRDALAGIEVWVASGGDRPDMRLAGTIDETGPIATDVK